jgi:hypothetical protein
MLKQNTAHNTLSAVSVCTVKATDRTHTADRTKGTVVPSQTILLAANEPLAPHSHGGTHWYSQEHVLWVKTHSS